VTAKAKRPTQRDVANVGTLSTIETGRRLGGMSRQWVAAHIDRQRNVLCIPIGGRVVEIDVIPHGRTWRVPTRRLDDALAGDG
jgi:hypothetical protein